MKKKIFWSILIISIFSICAEASITAHYVCQSSSPISYQNSKGQKLTKDETTQLDYTATMQDNLNLVIGMHQTNILWVRLGSENNLFITKLSTNNQLQNTQENFIGPDIEITSTTQTSLGKNATVVCKVSLSQASDL